MRRFSGRNCARAVVAGAAAATQKRRYTPIYATPAPQDRLGAISRADDVQALWGTERDGFIANVPAAIRHWVRWGNHPLLSETPKNVWAAAEDDIGSNIVDSSSEARYKESVKFWQQHYEQQYLTLLRQERDTSASDIGTLSTIGQLEDEADRPETDWSRDSHFMALQDLARRHLKTNVRKLEDLEMVLRTTTPEKFTAFMMAAPKPMHGGLPLPSLALWHYSESRAKEWCAAWQKRRLDAESTHRTLSALARIGQQGWRDVAAQMEKLMTEINAIRIARVERQVKAGLVKDWAAMTPAEKLEACVEERGLYYRSLVEGEPDPTDKRDTTPEWTAEQEKIQELAMRDLGHGGLTLAAIWKDCVALDELETEHLHTDAHYRELAAAALRRARDEHGLAAVLAASAEALGKSTYDARSHVLVPHLANPIYIKLNWARFGGATVLHHGPKSKRQMRFNAQTLDVAAAVATLYYHLKPLSSSLNYSTPYNMRHSLVSNYANVGVAFNKSAHGTYLRPMKLLADAENAMRPVVASVKHDFGLQRRAAYPAARAANQRHETPVTAAAVLPLKGEDGKVVADANTIALCSIRELSVNWPSQHLEALAKNPPPKTAKGLLEKAERLRRGGIEVSLWRRVPAGKTTVAHDVAQRNKDAAAKLVAAVPELAAVKAEVTAALERLTGTKLQPPPAELKEDWEFVTMIHDNHPLTENQRVEVLVPYHALAVGNELGRPVDTKDEYRFRVRCFDNEANPQHLPQRCSETFTEPFHVVDLLPQVSAKHFGADNVTMFDGRELVPFFQALRDAGVTTPLQLEFEAGQALTPKGEVLYPNIVRLFHEGRHFSLGAKEQLTDQQLEAEPRIRRHWELTHPGATEEEWFGVRRAVLDAAMEREREWWAEEPLLEAPVTIQNHRFAARYSADSCTVLSAEGDSSTTGLEVPTVTCTYAGDGTVRSLDINEIAAKERHLSLDDILGNCLTAINRAHNRLNTLSAVKTAEFQKNLQKHSLLSSGMSELGGKYGRTYAQAYRDALLELDGGIDIAAAEREKAVDRFASEDHPEQRRTTFAPRFDTNNANLDDPENAHNSQWNNSI